MPKAKDDRHAQARKQLDALAGVEGALVVITAVPAKGGHDDPRHPDFWVQHGVVSLEDHPTKKGAVIARTAEGDWTMGYPADVLARLTEVGRVPR